MILQACPLSNFCFLHSKPSMHQCQSLFEPTIFRQSKKKYQIVGQNLLLLYVNIHLVVWYLHVPICSLSPSPSCRRPKHCDATGTPARSPKFNMKTQEAKASLQLGATTPMIIKDSNGKSFVNGSLNRNITYKE